MSFSSLRAKSAGNLLHFGKTIKAKDAEVKLNIQVSKRISEDGKIKLARKLSSDGTSVYRINTKRSTRLNLIDSLVSINIFPDSHNIVRQGDITKFVNMTPRERRGLIEVVAGIELYEKGSLVHSGSSPLTNLTQYNTLGTFNVTVKYPE